MPGVRGIERVRVHADLTIIAPNVPSALIGAIRLKKTPPVRLPFGTRTAGRSTSDSTPRGRLVNR